MKFTQELVFEKLKKYCAYQDRCHSEVRTKIISLKVYGDDLEEIIAELINEKFLDEERFARAYARGRFRMKKWGRNKIKQYLQAKRVSAYCIKAGMTEIDEEEYLATLRGIVEKELEKQKHLGDFQSKDKAIKYAYGRGYESTLIFSVIKEIENG